MTAMSSKWKKNKTCAKGRKLNVTSDATHALALAELVSIFVDLSIRGGYPIFSSF